MLSSPKTYLLLLCLSTFSFASSGQELDSLKSPEKVLDRLELEALVSLHETQEFNAIPGVGGQINLYAPFYNGRLRLGLGIGFGRQTFSYELEEGEVRLGPIRSYSSQLDANFLNADLTIGSDLLPNSKMKLIIAAGIRMNYLFNGNYHFNFRQVVEESRYQFPADPSIHPAVIASVSFDYPITKRSSIGISYSFSYSFLPFKLQPNSSSGTLFYQMEWYPEVFTDEAQNLIASFPSFVSPDDPFYLIYYDFLEVPSYLGGQHSFGISYRYAFGLGKKGE